MNFNVDRLSRLAGLESQSGQLNEASNRSYHDDPSLVKTKEGEYVWGKNQLNEEGGDAPVEAEVDPDENEEVTEGGASTGDQSASRRDYMDERGSRRGDQSKSKSDYEHDEDMDEAVHDDKPGWGQKKWDSGLEEEETIQLDEKMIRRELLKMRKEQLEETALRRSIRGEITDILKDLDLYRTGEWVYGNNKPRPQELGKVTRGFVGPGFKR